jgi:phosphonate transport system substrate-binding protein
MVRHMRRSISPLSLIGAAAILLLVNGLVLADLQRIETAPPPPPAAPPAPPAADRPTVRIGVISRFAPNLIYAGYQPIIDYLNRAGSFHYELRLSKSYQDAVDRLREGEVAASFLGAWMTGRLDPAGDLVPLLAPLNDRGASEFHAVLVTGPDSGVQSLEQLSDRRVALPSDQSWSGNWLEVSGLPRVGLALADLDSVHHFEHHHTVVWQILRGNFDAGVVKESVAERYRSEGLVAVAQSDPIPGPPLVGNRSASQAALDEIARLLLAVDPRSEGGRRLLDTWTPEFAQGFTAVDFSHYTRAFGQERGRP